MSFVLKGRKGTRLGKRLGWTWVSVSVIVAETLRGKEREGRERDLGGHGLGFLLSSLRHRGKENSALRNFNISIIHLIYLEFFNNYKKYELLIVILIKISNIAPYFKSPTPCQQTEMTRGTNCLNLVCTLFLKKS